MKKIFFTDIHCHTTLRSINTPAPENGRNPWENTHNLVLNTTASRWARFQTREIAKYSQANLYKMAEAGVRVVFDALYPVEKGFLQFRRFPNLLTTKKSRDQAMVTALGIDPARLEILRQHRDYFPELQEQFSFISKMEGKSPDGKWQYKLAGNYTGLKKILDEDSSSIAIILSIEGGHAFGTGCPASLKLRDAELKETVSENIRIVKRWASPPFFVNLAHHYWNQLCGQARSFKPPIHMIFDQKKGLNRGITGPGWHTLKELLSKENGKRILPDVKHMSLKSRMEYYEYVKRHNREFPDQIIPVICSHTGVSGVSTFGDQKKRNDNARWLSKGQFNSWSINLPDEEIRFITSTGGLIGIMMDKGMLCSQALLEKIKKIKSEKDRRMTIAGCLAANIERIMKAAGHEGWKSIALGTDFDGLISHFDCWPDAGYLPEMARDLEEFLNDNPFPKNISAGLNIKEMLTRIFQKNTIAFLKKYF